MPTIKIGPVPTTYDEYFRRYAGGIPVPFIRALSKWEAGLDPDAKNPGSSATGLLQVIDSTREGYNKAHGTSYTREDLKNPDIGAKIGVEELLRIVTSYARNHPKTLKEDWNNPRYVALVVAGFNAGWSEVEGVGKVVGFLESKGFAPERINADTVSESSQAAGGSKYLREADRVEHWKRVTDTFYAQPDAPVVLKESGFWAQVRRFGPWAIGGVVSWHLWKKFRS